MPSEDTYRQLARQQWQLTNQVEFDEHPVVSTSEAGAWVQAWVWVDKEAAPTRP